MATDPQVLTEAFEAIGPQLEDLCTSMKTWLEALAEDLAIEHPRIEGRVKTLDSLLLKAHRKEVEGQGWTDPITEASDKVGLRADLVYRDDRDRLIDAIVQADVWEGPPHVDDKESALGSDKLGYQGVHIDVVPRARPGGLSAPAAVCEIQVRTNAQSAWAMGVHDLTYKGVPADDQLLRRVNRLTALLELVDAGIGDARDVILNGESYPIAQFIAELQRLRVQFTTVASDEALTRDIVMSLVTEPDVARELAPQVAAFVAQEEGRLRGVLTRPGHPIVRQPEALLVFMWLEEDPFALQDQWGDAGLPNALLERLAGEWGVSLPTPT